MIRFTKVPTAEGQLLLCLKENTDGSTTVIATCDDDDQHDPHQPRGWRVVPAALELNAVGRASLELLIANAYSACFNVSYFATILGRSMIESLTMKE